jgi:DNA-binding CsgD family transcriptional regulator
VRVKTAHGEPIVCRLTAKAIYAFGQKCTLLMLQDVSDRHRNEVQLFEAIESVMKDTSWFSRSVIERLAVLRAPPGNGSASAALKDLTPREREVIGLISHGLSDAEIAQRLGLTRSTVRNHVATLYSKISVHSRSSAIVWARERGVNIAYPAKSKPGPTPLGSSRLSPVKMNRTSAKRQAWLTEADRALSGD